MRKALCSKEMRKLEERGQKMGISKLMMMENAGSSIASYLQQRLSHSKQKKIVAIAGTGNNGGDLFVAARHLLYWRRNFRVSIVLMGSEDNIRAKEARTNWEIITQLPGLKKLTVDSMGKMGQLRKEMSTADVLVIGIFGTGFHGVPRELQRRAIEEINSAKKPFKVSVDLPSGLECDSGISDYSIHSDVTITMHSPKIGLLKSKVAGKIIEANIGLPF